MGSEMCIRDRLIDSINRGLRRAAQTDRLDASTAALMFHAVADLWPENVDVTDVAKTLMAINQSEAVSRLMQDDILNAEFSGVGSVLLQFRRGSVSVPRERLHRLIVGLDRKASRALYLALDSLAGHKNADDRELFEGYLHHESPKVAEAAAKGLDAVN